MLFLFLRNFLSGHAMFMPLGDALPWSHIYVSLLCDCTIVIVLLPSEEKYGITI